MPDLTQVDDWSTPATPAATPGAATDWSTGDNSGTDAPPPSWLLDMLKSGGTGALTGIAATPGVVADAIRLGGLGIGKLVGSESMAQDAREGLGGGVGGSAWIEAQLKKAGILPSYVPQTEAGKWAYNVGDFAGGSVGLGVGGLARAGLKGAVELSAKGAAKALAKDALTGTGAGLGHQAADQAVTAVEGEEGASPWLRGGVDLAGALVGGGLAGAGHNLAFSRADTDLTDAYKALGVKPRFPSDVAPMAASPDFGIQGGGGGAVSKLFNTVIPGSFGAQKTSQAAARDVQQQLSQATERVLGTGYGQGSSFYHDPLSMMALVEEGHPEGKLWQLGSETAPTATGEQFNLDKFMTNWRTMPRDEKATLLRDHPDLESKINMVDTAYQGTAESRALAEKGIHDALHEPAMYGLPGLMAGGAHLLGQGIGGIVGGGALGAGVTMAGPALAARASQNWLQPAMAALSKPQIGGPRALSNPIGVGSRYAAPAAMSLDQSTLSDYYTPPPAVPPKTGDLHSWLGSMDRGTATALVSSKLGPQLGQQLAQAGDGEQYGAALMNLSADPRYRQMLQG